MKRLIKILSATALMVVLMASPALASHDGTCHEDDRTKQCADMGWDVGYVPVDGDYWVVCTPNFCGLP